jgi:hypothetical protein
MLLLLARRTEPQTDGGRQTDTPPIDGRAMRRLYALSCAEKEVLPVIKHGGGLLLICFLVTACGAQRPAHQVSSTLDPCALVTADEVTTVVGFQATRESVSDNWTVNDIVHKVCAYEYTNPAYNVDNGFAVITYPTHVNISMDVAPDASSAQDQFRIAKEILTDAQTIRGLGDAAVAGSTPFSSLYVLKDNAVLDVWWDNQVPYNALDLGKQIAQIALKRL